MREFSLFVATKGCFVAATVVMKDVSKPLMSATATMLHADVAAV